MNKNSRYERVSFSNVAQLEAITLGMDTARLEDIEIAGKPENRFKAVVNDSTQGVEAIVSDKYTLILHREIFDPVVQAMKQFGIGIKGTVTKDGGRCYADILFDDPRFKVDIKREEQMQKLRNGEKSDIINFGLRFFNSYDKTTSFGAEVFAQRLVCLNGMIGIVKIKSIHEIHAGDKKFVIKAIANLFEALANESYKFKDIVERARKEIVTEQMLNELLVSWKLGEKHIKEILLRAKKLDELNNWEIYNILTSYITKSMEVRESTKERWHKQYANQILYAPIPVLIQKQKVRSE